MVAPRKNPKQFFYKIFKKMIKILWFLSNINDLLLIVSKYFIIDGLIKKYTFFKYIFKRQHLYMLGCKGLKIYVNTKSLVIQNVNKA